MDPYITANEKEIITKILFYEKMPESEEKSLSFTDYCINLVIDESIWSWDLIQRLNKLKDEHIKFCLKEKKNK